MYLVIFIFLSHERDTSYILAHGAPRRTATPAIYTSSTTERDSYFVTPACSYRRKLALCDSRRVTGPRECQRASFSLPGRFCPLENTS